MTSEPLFSQDPSPKIPDRTTLQNAVLYKINQRSFAKGELTFPCLPNFVDCYIQKITGLFTTLQKPFSQSEVENLRQQLVKRMEEGFQASPHSYVTFRYQPAQPPQTGFICQVSISSSSVAQQYNTWVSARQPPLFGKYPDAKLMEVVKNLGNPESTPILDIGAGTGRNTIPLAQLGHPVDAVELTPPFAQQIRDAAAEKNLPIAVTEGNILDPLVRMKPSHYQLALISEVISHLRDRDQLRLLLAKMCDFLCPGGLLLFNLFLTADGYELTDDVREWGLMAFSSIFTRAELSDAMDRLPLQFIEETSVYDYEKAHLPADGWPPTGWFQTWSTGRDVFPLQEDPPIRLQWVLCRRV
ncbi:MAG TPA: class I SAM-dependent methyltransferase [Oscillatoriales cyanobacterium M59_W2019_021]|nr:MAG: class I SAM-dependent methyltransferase [Cyanobacteria bacterium J055]HIK33816.1 class I SAM-dependent methyltransferase [Oscillatoriales cyanobacterium M4454_W2019_049]HIK51598.1 class I SAM-dependent methyltransferase [Oscillatoriales cyanobacterium M59_W2019_021]